MITSLIRGNNEWIESNQLLAVKSTADIFWVDLHFAPEEHENISPTIHRKIL